MVNQHRKSSTQTSTNGQALETSQDGCWVDFFDGPVFSGTMRRLRGPVAFPLSKRASAPPRSLIVGPDAVVVILGNTKAVKLNPNQVLPDLAKIGLSGRLDDFRILPSRATAKALARAA